MRHKYFGNIKLTLKNMAFGGTASSTVSDKKYEHRLQKTARSLDSKFVATKKSHNLQLKVENPMAGCTFLLLSIYIFVSTTK